MSQASDNVLADSSAAVKKFLSYFHEAIDCLVPISELDEDPRQVFFESDLSQLLELIHKCSPLLRMASAAAQTLMQEIVQDMRWFRCQNQLSARQVGDLEIQLGNIQPATNHAEAWHQSLTIDNINEKIGEASQVYGTEGLSRLSQLQEKIIKVL
jgi:hypothetical protein